MSQPNSCHIKSMSMDDVFRALADPVRRELLEPLHAKNGQTLGELCEGHECRARR